jgi:hypothetical protein
MHRNESLGPADRRGRRPPAAGAGTVTKLLCPAGMFFMRTMREVDTNDIDTCIDQAVDD